MSDPEDSDEFDEEESDDLDEIENEDEALDIDDDDDSDLDDDDEESEDLRSVEKEMSQKDQNARSLAIRREIERRMEQKRLAEDLDYLDLDLED